jgi:glycogen debranching enzyme
MLTASTEHGPFPYAGVPWFCTPFGRDALITAYEVLWLAPAMAVGVLRFLAAHQARDDNPDRDAEPGKILHEMRAGEMANLGEVPFGCYYGSVDATPWFVLLAAAYHERTGDLDLMRELWPALERAVAWMEGPGDLDGDGFVEYRRRAPMGLSNCARCRPTFTPRASGSPPSPARSAMRGSPRSSSAPRSTCATRSRRRSGSPTSAPTP